MTTTTILAIIAFCIVIGALILNTWLFIKPTIDMINDESFQPYSELREETTEELKEN